MKSADVPIEHLDENLEEQYEAPVRVKKTFIDFVAVALRLTTACLFLIASIFLIPKNIAWSTSGNLILSGMSAYFVAVGIEVYKQYVSPLSNVGLFAGILSMSSLLLLFAGGIMMRQNEDFTILPSVSSIWIAGTCILFVSQVTKGFVSFEHGPLRSFSFGSAALGSLLFLIASIFFINDFYLSNNDALVVASLFIVGSAFYLIHAFLFLIATIFYEIYYEEGNISVESHEDGEILESINCVVRLTVGILLIAGSSFLHPNLRSSRIYAGQLFISGFAFYAVAVSIEVYKNRSRGALIVGAHINSFVAITLLLLGSVHLLVYLPHEQGGMEGQVIQANEICSIWIAGSLLLFVALMVESIALLKDDPGHAGVRSGGSIGFASLGSLFYTIGFSYVFRDLKHHTFTSAIERNNGWLIAGSCFYFVHSILYIFSFSKRNKLQFR